MSFLRKRESILFFNDSVKMKTYYVYIMASKMHGTLYIGVTNDLIDGFTKKYGVHILVYYERTDDVYSAIQREKNMKKWERKWKIELIESVNPEWRDLSEEFLE